MANNWLKELTSTAQVDPAQYAAQISPNRMKSLGYAIAGWIYMLRRQQNTRIMAVASIAVMIFAFWLQITRIELAILIVTITIVWMAEFINAGIEAAVDLASPEIHPLAKVGKDVASAAVLLGVVAAVLIGLLLLLPPLLLKLGIQVGW
jgi:diacylglycerol kinase